MELFKVIAVRKAEVREHYADDAKAYELYDHYCGFEGDAAFDYIAVIPLSYQTEFIAAQTVKTQEFTNVVSE